MGVNSIKNYPIGTKFSLSGETEHTIKEKVIPSKKGVKTKSRKPKQQENTDPNVPKNDGRFKKGSPGGPGRPQGSRNSVTIAIEQIGLENAMAIFERLLGASLGTIDNVDKEAAKYILERIVPARKGARFPLSIPRDINTVEKLNEATDSLLNMVAEGEISIEESNVIAETLNARAKSIELNIIMPELEFLREEVKRLKRLTGKN